MKKSGSVRDEYAVVHLPPLDAGTFSITAFAATLSCNFLEWGWLLLPTGGFLTVLGLASGYVGIRGNRPRARLGLFLNSVMVTCFIAATAVTLYLRP